MTPKRYSQNSPLIQWAYLWEEVRPLQTSTCALFWRSVVLTPAKTLGPALIGGFVVFFVFAVPFLHWLWPESVHGAWFFNPHHVHGAPRRPFNWSELWPLGVFGVLVFVVWAGNASGFWAWFHGLCKPVEIEGGLVRKGGCPADGCVARLVVEADGVWRCPRCKGQFTPAAKSVSPSDSR
jgi:hypothetical protein